MNKKKILSGILCLSLLTPIIQHINAQAMRDRTLDQMITDSFVIIDDDGNSRIVQLETIASQEEEISVADKYEVVSHIGGEIEVIDEFASEQEAIQAANLIEEETTVQPFNLDAVNYGIVYINTSGVTEYTMVETGQIGYTSGAYGVDGAYIGEFNGKIRARYAGTTADFDPEDVNVVNFEGNKTSYYIEQDGILRHFYLYGSGKYYESTRVGYDLEFLEEDVVYYSYDGHYFYDTYQNMIDDYKAGTSTRAVNPDQPYYNYYQYLSHRSTTTLTGDELNALTVDIIKATSYETSLFKDIGNEFINQQNKYTVNATLMYGVAANESNWGRSEIARDKNNLFGHGANDSNPYWDANGYDSVAQSIEYHAFHFVSQAYLDYGDWRHFGPHLGDKEGGLNVKYASDPYWGEKAASRAYFIESGANDYEKETIGIITGPITSCNLYQEPSTSSKIITTLKKLSNVPVLILEEVEVNGTVWYKIASDTPLTDGRTAHDWTLVYRPEQDYLYIEASKVMIVNKGENMKEKVDPFAPGSTDGNITIPELESGKRVYVSEGNLITETKTTVEQIKAINENAVIKTGDTEITDVSASVGTGYTVTINDKTYTIVKLGDVNGDGNLSPLDYVKVKNHIMKASTLEGAYLTGADISLDGKISPLDYVKIKNAILAH